MDVEQAIRGRRTHKAYRPEPIAEELLRELLDLARWAPNHNLTNPWRFRVLGAQARALLAAEAERENAGAAVKLGRAPTLVLASALLAGDERQQREDLLSAGIACYIVLLAAHARGLGGYWRTLPLLDSAVVKQGLGIGAAERAVGLLHLGQPVQSQRIPERLPLEQVVSFLP